MGEISPETEIRSEAIDGISNWLWLKDDRGGWGGPKNDWEQFHHDKIQMYVKNFDTVIQAGGCMGMYPRLLSQMFKLVYTFEPDWWNFNCLAHNCNKANIIKFQAALGEEQGTFTRISRGNRDNAGTSNALVSDEGTVPQMMVDQFKFRECNLLMLDVEGHEREAVQGAIETINRFRPVIFVELNHNSPRDIIESFDYKKVDDASQDMIFLPAERVK